MTTDYVNLLTDPDAPIAGARLRAAFSMEFEQGLDGGPVIKDSHYISSLADRTGAQNINTAVSDKAQQISEEYGGGFLKLGPGILLLDCLEHWDGVVYEGEGHAATIVRQAPNTHTEVDSGTSSGGNTSTTFNDTSKAWAAEAYRWFTIEIVSGTGAGQTRPIGMFGGTATQQSLQLPWAVTPDATSVYKILKSKALIELRTTDLQFVGAQHMLLDGNKANQKAYNGGLYLDNTIGVPFFDSHHAYENLLIVDTKGSGVRIGKNIREARFQAVRVYRSGLYGKITDFEGGTDNWWMDCTFAQSALFGMIANSDNDHIGFVKCFGNGVDNISGNAGGFQVSRPCFLVNPDTQENRGPGLHILNIHNVVASAITMDANGGAGVFIDNSFDCIIDGSVRSAAGLLYQTTWALHNINGSDRNKVTLNVRSAELLGGMVEPTSFWGSDNRFEINSRLYGRTYSVGREPEVAAEDHFTVGKQDSPATGNPSYSWTTDISAIPKSLLVGNDGTSTKTFITFDFQNSRLTLGDTGVVVNLMGAVSFNSHLIAATDNTYDIGASGANRFRDLFISRNAVVAVGLVTDLVKSRTNTPLAFQLSDATVVGSFSNTTGALAANYGVDIVGQADVAGMVRSTGLTVPSTGSGMEMYFIPGAPGQGYLTSYNRGTSTPLPLQINASAVLVVAHITTGVGYSVTASAADNLRLNAPGGQTVQLIVDAVPRLTVASTGVTVPGALLEVSTVGQATDVMVKVHADTNKYAQFAFYENTALKWNMYNEPADDSFNFGTSGGLRLMLSSAGVLGIAATGSVTAAAASNLLLNAPTGQSVNITINSVAVVTTAASGVTVTGTALITGNATFAADLISSRGTDGSTNDEHFRFGKVGSGTAGNPYYAWKTDNSASAKATLSGWDGTSSRLFLTLDHAAPSLTLGDAGITVYVAEHLTAAGIVSSLVGTAGSTTNDHYRFGKVGSGSASNPYYKFITNNEAVPDLILQGYDGTTTRDFFRIDFATNNVGAITLGQGGAATHVFGLLNVIGITTLAAMFATSGTFVGAVASTVGSDGSTNDEHFRFGKVGSGVAGNPYYTWKTDSSAQAKAMLSSWDGTNAYTFIKLDHAAATMTIGDAAVATVAAGAFTVIGASTLAGLTATSLVVSGGTALAALAATTGAFSGNVGFNGSGPIAKPAVTGSRGANAALASLLTELANYGQVTDSTTV